MDALSDLLRGVRAGGAVYGRSRLRAPWALEFADGAALTMATMVRGGGWIVRPGADPVPLREGETAIVRGPEPFQFRDAPSPPRGPVEEVRCLGQPADRISCSHHSAGPGGVAGAAGGLSRGGAEPVLLAGAYPVAGAVGDRLLDTLPPALTVPPDPACAGVLDFVSDEMRVNRPGQDAVVERMMEWLLVCTLRAWFDTGNAPAWYRSLSDPVAGPALRAIHDRPAHPWTVEALARAAGLSRARFAARFRQAVGEPPLAYLTGWRMALAADLLTEPGATVATVAHRVGYADPFGFSAAFKRRRGVSPSAHRAAAQAVQAEQEAGEGSAAEADGSGAAAIRVPH